MTGIQQVSLSRASQAPCSGSDERVRRVLEALSDTMGTNQYIKFVQKLCQEGVWGPKLPNTSEKHVWGLRPHIFVALLLGNSGPQIPLGKRVLHIFSFLFLAQRSNKSWPIRDSAPLFA